MSIYPFLHILQVKKKKLTNKNIQHVNETDPRRPDAASRPVKGTDCAAETLGINPKSDMTRGRVCDNAYKVI